MKRIRLLRGFSVIEALIATGILAVLIVITFSVQSTLVEHTQSTQCIQNLRVLHAGIMAYANDHQMEIPYDEDNIKVTVKSWWTPLRKNYIPHHGYATTRKAPWFCPSNPVDPKTGGAPGWTNYSINLHLYTGAYNAARGLDETRPRRLNALRSNLIILIDSYEKGYKPFETWYTTTGGNYPGGGRASPWRFVDPIHHGRKINALFLDGHVESLVVVPKVSNPVTGDVGELKSQWFYPVQ
ncbi:MAG TPA: hypothetical protein VNQ90_13910 [Chthoniobacteraceae bacterium]|nr:hypothetical protein [Chthoniobacteraceae bacterium]